MQYDDPTGRVFLLLLFYLLFLICRHSEPNPLQPVYVVLVHDHEAQNDGEPPQRVHEHPPCVGIAAKLVELPRSANPYSIRHDAGQRKRPRREPRERNERGANAREEQHVPQRDEAVLARIEHSEHVVPALRIRATHELRERVEMRELPRKHKRKERPRRKRVLDDGGGGRR